MPADAPGETMRGAVLSAQAPLVGGAAGTGGLSERVYPDSVPSNIDSGVKMVGSGTACGITKWVITGKCSKCGHPVELHKSTCGRIECPDCYKGWARRASDRVGLRVWGYLHALGDYRYKPWHIVLSIPGCTEWKKYKELAAEFGCTGGVMVIHPFRVIRSVARTIQDAASAEHLNRYDYIRKHGLWNMLEYSPHAHVIGYGYMIENKPDSAFQYRKIRPIMDRGAVERAAYYLLSHAMMPKKGRHLVKYFGVCSYSKLGAIYIGTRHEPMACPCCGGPCVDEGNSLLLVKSTYGIGWFLRSKRIKPG